VLTAGERSFAKLMPQLFTWFYWFVTLAILVSIAVISHRLVLLGQESIQPGLLPRWSKRESKFFLWMLLGVFSLLIVVFLVSGLVFMVVFSDVKAEKDFLLWPVLLSFIPFLYVLARFSLMFPGIALDRNVGLKWSWRATENNGWRITLVVFGVPWILSFVFDLLSRDGATAVEVVVLTFLATVTMVFEIAALSLAYRELAGGE
jgi:hypothetical protein